MSEMNVANKKLCQELYELSGWDDTFPSYHDVAGLGVTIPFNPSVCTPAYTLGYLLRNLPKSIERDGRHYALHLQHDLSRTLWRITYGGTGKLRQNMSTGRAPEDAAAKIAIELFKQGILKRARTMTNNPTDTNQAGEYPPYACSCCGVANGDMFWDYIEHNKDTLTYGEVLRMTDDFDTYRKEWNAHAEATREAVRADKPRIPRKRYAK